MAAHRRRKRRKGNILVFSAVLMIVMMAMLAFAVDLGYLSVARNELQRSADASALAAAWELVDFNSAPGADGGWDREALAREKASQYAGFNRVLLHSPALSQNDVQIGYLSNPADPTSPLDLSGLNSPNAVRVCVRRTAQQNGAVPLFFARALGITEQAAQADATAVLVSSVIGFRAPSDGSNSGLLPLSLDKKTWDDMLDCGIGTDDWCWDVEHNQIVPGSDGVLEVNLYPQGVDAPGNRGTVDIGSSNNSTADIARQILHGASKEDLAYFPDGELKLDENGELGLNGDTGISAGVKDELASIKGKPRLIPIFREVAGNGNNAEYTIVGFAGIRIMDVRLTGKMSSKRVIIQPANCIVKGVIPSTSGATTSHFIYSPVWLVQ